MDYSPSGACRGLGSAIWDHDHAGDWTVSPRDFSDCHALLNFSWVDQITFFFFFFCNAPKELSAVALLHFSVCIICLVKSAFSQLLGNIYIYTGAWGARIPKASPLICFLFLKRLFTFGLPLSACGLLSFQPFPSGHMLLLQHGEWRANWALNLNMWHQKTKWQCWQALDHPQALWLPSNWICGLN